MTNRYTVLPLDPNNLDWLHGQGVAVSDVSEPSRYPTLVELRQSLASLSDYAVEYGRPSHEEPWDVTITMSGGAKEEAPSVLKITPYQGEDVPHGFWFEGSPPPLMVALLQKLAVSTGPVALLAISDGSATVVEGSTDVQAVLDSWKHTAGK